MNIEWKKSTRCGTNACVEVAFLETYPLKIAVRNTDDPAVTVYFTEDEWNAFIAGVKTGEFDL